MSRCGKTFFQHGAEPIPGRRRLFRAGLGQQRHAGFHEHRIGHGGAQALPLEHQPVAGRTAATLRWRGAQAPYTEGQVVACDTGFEIHHPHLPLPQVQGVANVEKLLLAVQLQFVKWLWTGSSGGSC